MNTTTRLHGLRRTDVIAQLTRDYAYILPGLPIAVFSFALLMAMTVASAATLVIWVGALLMAVTLLFASGFAALSRKRAVAWGAVIAPVSYRGPGRGVLGPLRMLSEARRWLDLIFEMLIALPLRLLLGVLTICWTMAALLGLTAAVWLIFAPEAGGPAQILELNLPEMAPQTPTGKYLVDVSIYGVLGLIFSVTLPFVLHGFARLDATLTGALLGGDPETLEDPHSAVSAGSELPRVSRGRDGSGAPGVAGALEEGSSLGSGSADEGFTPAGDVASSVSAGGFSGRAWAWIGAGFAGLVLLSVSWPLTAVLYSVNVALAMLLTVAHSGAVLITLRWVWPGLALSVVTSASVMGATAAAYPDAGAASVWPWPVITLITQTAVLAVASLAHPWYAAASAWCAGAGLTVITLTFTDPDVLDRAVTISIVFASITAGVVVIGTLARLWILSAGRLEVAQRSSAEQDRRRQELQDRNRIARELHDVVAHSMSVISVQASTAPYRNPGLGEEAQREFSEISESSRQALSEMRMLLSILRGDDEAPTAPEPGVERIEDLIRATRASGATIDYHGLPAGETEGEGPGAAASQAAYRMVQEALSNALRHAPGAAVRVELWRQEKVLHVLVVNGPGTDPGAGPAVGAGLGLAGIRERASAVGGTAQAQPTADGGFCLEAELPWGGPS